MRRKPRNKKLIYNTHNLDGHQLLNQSCDRDKISTTIRNEINVNGRPHEMKVRGVLTRNKFFTFNRNKKYLQQSSLTIADLISLNIYLNRQTLDRYQKTYQFSRSGKNIYPPPFFLI